MPKYYVIIPVAIPGSGKSTLSKALLDLFPHWGHFQSDLVQGKGTKAKILTQQCVEFLYNCQADQSRVVIVDRNNHLSSQRNDLTTSIKAVLDQKSMAVGNDPDHNEMVYICWNFAPVGLRDSSINKEKWATMKQLGVKRIYTRGDSHPTIKAATADRKRVHMIMGMFLKAFQPVDVSREPDSRFDLVLTMDSTSQDSTLNNLRMVIKSLRQKYKDEFVLEDFSEERLLLAFRAALRPEELPPGPVQIKFELEADRIPKLVDEFLASQSSPEAVTAKHLWQTQKENKQVLQHFQFPVQQDPVLDGERSLKRVKLDQVVTVKALVFSDSIIALSIIDPSGSPKTVALTAQNPRTVGKEQAEFRRSMKTHKHIEWNDLKIKCFAV